MLETSNNIAVRNLFKKDLLKNIKSCARIVHYPRYFILFRPVRPYTYYVQSYVNDHKWTRISGRGCSGIEPK